jgi:methylenetetrahydrofolate reductase (NADPH)
MRNEKKFADQIKDGDFIVTAEFLPRAETDGSSVKAALDSLKHVPSAVNVSDNPFGVIMSSMAASVLLAQSGIEPIYQIVTRDRNRIAIQSDLLGAASLGIRNMLCLSGYHQTLTNCPESANVYDLDSTQLIAMVKRMRENGELLDGTKIGGSFPVITGAVANPYLKPIELNIIRLSQKVDAGAGFIQTHAVFNTDEFRVWLETVGEADITGKTAIIAGIFPFDSANEALRLRDKYTEFQIPDSLIERLKSAGDMNAQKREGITICAEIINKLQDMRGLRGIHLLSGGKEEMIPEILSAAGILVKG